MIWLGSVCVSFVFLLLALYTLRKAQANERILDELRASTIALAYRHPAREPLDLFEGPARLELFGHVTHVGWVRQGAERIDVLTIEGEALQCDARSRYRLTPLTWREFVDECLRRKDRCVGQLEHEVKLLKRARDETEERRGALRCAIAEALELFGGSQNWGPEVLADRTHQAIVKLSDAREKDEEHDALPF